VFNKCLNERSSILILNFRCAYDFDRWKVTVGRIVNCLFGNANLITITFSLIIIKNNTMMHVRFVLFIDTFVNIMDFLCIFSTILSLSFVTDVSSTITKCTEIS
jgi:hypothetical protein